MLPGWSVWICKIRSIHWESKRRNENTIARKVLEISCANIGHCPQRDTRWIIVNIRDIADKKILVTQGENARPIERHIDPANLESNEQTHVLDAS